MPTMSEEGQIQPAQFVAGHDGACQGITFSVECGWNIRVSTVMDSYRRPRGPAPPTSVGPRRRSGGGPDADPVRNGPATRAGGGHESGASRRTPTHRQ